MVFHSIFWYPNCFNFAALKVLVTEVTALLSNFHSSNNSFTFFHNKLIGKCWQNQRHQQGLAFWSGQYVSEWLAPIWGVGGPCEQISGWVSSCQWVSSGNVSYYFKPTVCSWLYMCFYFHYLESIYSYYDSYPLVIVWSNVAEAAFFFLLHLCVEASSMCWIPPEVDPQVRQQVLLRCSLK